MIDKSVRMIKALGEETIKRLPYIALLLLILTLFGGYQSYRKTAEGVEIAKDNSLIIKQLAEDNKRLSEQNKQLSEENRRLAAQNQAYIKCIADVFARYTRDFRPVIIEDLAKCKTPTSDTQQSTTSSDTSTPSNPQPQTENKQSPKPDNPNQPEQPPGIVERAGDIVCDLPLVPCEGLPL